MSDTGRWSKHECYCYDNDCPKTYRLSGGYKENTIFKFHFDTLDELKDFLGNRNQWTAERLAVLMSTYRVTDGDEWATLLVK